MIISNELQQLMRSSDHEEFKAAFMLSFVKDAQTRNPDVISDNMLRQLALPKYNDAIKAINKELESLKIINRRNEKS